MKYFLPLLLLLAACSNYKTVHVYGEPLKIRVLRTAEEQQTGLTARFADEAGAFFYLGAEAIYQFHGRGMPRAVKLFCYDADKQLVGQHIITPDQPPFHIEQPFRYAIELQDTSVPGGALTW